ncbi:toxin-antitoxin system, antitoxin component [Aphanothece hegewaldii CCALA 016]|uniref:Toxin-antitoxin system, antitoxin component n=2 Tax=Aphanothece TaxID=1121 RepID=A0A2T1LVS2_9CHRO|nr:antitoxin Xre/MbcA/ParS toxin-binding domain-containing protein [Aphanothece hegewaldii]PSF35831.1 toxin-antitoxin system, antitoxin component [Aphanothece hegewaldii CCALA 016]
MDSLRQDNPDDTKNKSVNKAVHENQDFVHPQLESRIASILGLADQPTDTGSLRLQVREGLPPTTVGEVERYLEIARKQLVKLTGISERTVSRKCQRQQLLDPVVSDRLFRIARIAAGAEEVFESQLKARLWLKRPNRALGGAIPLDLLDTDAGTLQVSDLLGRIEYGVFS